MLRLCKRMGSTRKIDLFLEKSNPLVALLQDLSGTTEYFC
jgi:hypothetical protein